MLHRTMNQTARSTHKLPEIRHLTASEPISDGFSSNPQPDNPERWPMAENGADSNTFGSFDAFVTLGVWIWHIIITVALAANLHLTIRIARLLLGDAE